MIVKLYSNVPRLKTEEKTGHNHILVKKSACQSYRQHWHDYFEIEAVVSGTGKHVLNGDEYPIGVGDAYLLTPVDFHKIIADDTLEFINISFNTKWLSEEMQYYLYSPECVKRCRFDSSGLKNFISAAFLIKNEYENDGPSVRQLLEYLISRFSRNGESNAQNVVGGEHPDGIMRAVAYAQQHFRERITLDKLAKIAGYHPSYFSSLFCKVTGKTYTELLTDLRINYAKTLLKSGFSVSESCFASGFGSLSNFSSIFKKVCGMSPAAYKETDIDK